MSSTARSNEDAGDDEAPVDETVLVELDLTRALTLQWAMVGTLGFVVSVGAFGSLYVAATGAEPALIPQLVDAAWWNTALDLLVFVALTMGIVLPHEYVHGLAIRYFGGEPRYGVGLAHFVLPYAFATTDHRFDRDEFVVVALAPLVGLTVLGVPLMIVLEWGWLVVPLAANAGGAVGDLWMATTVLGYPKHVRVEDHSTGLRILGRPDDERRPHSVTSLAWDTVVGGAAATVFLAVALGLIGPFLLSALGVESIRVGRPGTVTFLFEYVETSDSLSFSVGVGIVLVGAALGLCYAFVRTIRRQRAGTT